MWILAPAVFFFQAEDGIRDRTVTGVQTCALPICPSHDHINVFPTHADYLAPFRTLLGSLPSDGLLVASSGEARSEERRVGKECHAGRVRPPVQNNTTDEKSGPGAEALHRDKRLSG